jgi:AcrR family transcriptional regulator
LWTGTIESHRAQVREAILRAAADLARRQGPTGLTMSRLAVEAGVGRATLYKYFTSVEAIIAAWQEHELAEHVERLQLIRAAAGDVRAAVADVLRAHADHARRRSGPDLSALLPHADAAHAAHRALHRLLRELLTEAAGLGVVRADIPATELAAYCLHALGAAHGARSAAATDRLVDAILSGLGVEA